MHLENPRHVWERRYSNMQNTGIRPNYEPWLDRWLPWLNEHAGKIPVLDLGCGSGEDAHYLSERGISIIANDYCRAALHSTRQLMSRENLLQSDFRDGLPFPSSIFRTIIASLCLHYFPWAQTQIILTEIHRCLQTGGVLLTRFNSINDVHHGAMGYEEIEPGCYIVGEAIKHFFDATTLKRLFQAGWKIHSLEEMTIYRYQKPKVVWELIAEKC